MLQLQVNQSNISEVTKLLFRYSIKAKITEKEIFVDGFITNDLLEKLCNITDILAFSNFVPEEVENHKEDSEIIDIDSDYFELETGNSKYEDSFEETEEELDKSDYNIDDECETRSEKTVDFISSEEEIDSNNSVFVSHAPENCDLIFTKVKRGEIYWCDLGEPYGSEMGFNRPIVIIQNDVGNENSPTTIAIPFTTAEKHKIHTHYEFDASSSTIISDFINQNPLRNSVLMAEQILTIDKSRLWKYIGRFDDKTMDELQRYIDISLNLRRESEVIVKEKKVYVAKPVKQEVIVDKNVKAERRDVNKEQVRVLSLIDINKLLEISESDDTNKNKAKKILELFGFDLKKKGVWYLQKAIYMAPKNEYFDLDILARRVADSEDTEKEEVKRVIVARIKEHFGLRKSIAIDFIRLIATFV